MKRVQALKVKVAQLCLTLCDHPMDCSTPGSSVFGILQARILVAISLSRGSSWLRDWTRVSCITSWFFTIWATREAQSAGLRLRSNPDLALHWPCDFRMFFSSISLSSHIFKMAILIIFPSWDCKVERMAIKCQTWYQGTIFSFRLEKRFI